MLRDVMAFVRAVLALIASLVGMAASGAVVSGRVVALPEREPEGFATVALFAAGDTVRPLSAVAADEAGRFTLRAAAAGEYVAKVSSVGRKGASVRFAFGSSDVDLGEIALEPGASMLAEVEVAAQRPLVSKEIDRIGYDVQADPESSTSTLTDMLRKVPMVSVDAEGNISVRNQSFKVYKNGKPNHSFSNNAKDIFAAIPASSIKKIEVITDPGAKEDAEGTGAILNIVTINDSPLKGVLGTASLALNTRVPLPLPRLWLTSQIGKVNFSISGGYNHQTYRAGRDAADARGTYHTTGNTLIQRSSGRTRSDNGWANVELSYDLDSMNLFTAEFSVCPYAGRSDGSDFVAMLDGDRTVYSYTNRYNRPRNRYTDLSGVFNYQHSTRRPGETLTLSYQVASTSQSRHFVSSYEDMVDMPVAYTGVVSDTRLDFAEHTAQFDWTRPINQHHKFDLGAKYIHRRNHSVSDYDYVGAGTTHDDFVHRTQVAAVYFDYRLAYGSFSARAGLRYEFSRLDARFPDGSRPSFGSNLNDLVPAASVMWQPDDANSLRANFSTSIQRPGISYLNPAVTASPYMVYFGNPDLESARVNNVSVNYSLTKNKIYLDASLFYTFANNQLCDVRSMEGNVLYQTYDNGDRQRMAYASLYLQYTPTDKTQLMFGGSGGYGRCFSPRTGAKVERWVWHPWVQVSQRLPWKLRLTANAQYGNGYVNSVYQYSEPLGAARFWWNLSLQRSFLANDRLTVRLYANNLFFPSAARSRVYSVNSDYTGVRDTYSYLNSYAGLSVSFRFGSLQAEVKKTDRSISNDDLQGKRL